MQIKDTQTLAISISTEDAKGNPAALDSAAVPAWTLDDATFGDIAVGSGGLSAVFTPNGKLGACNVQCSIPAVNDEPAMVGTLPVTVVASAASQIVLTGTAQG